MLVRWCIPAAVKCDESERAPLEVGSAEEAVSRWEAGISGRSGPRGVGVDRHCGAAPVIVAVYGGDVYYVAHVLEGQGELSGLPEVSPPFDELD